MLVGMFSFSFSLDTRPATTFFDFLLDLRHWGHSHGDFGIWVSIKFSIIAMKSLSGFLGGAIMKRKGCYKLYFMSQKGMKVCETWLYSKRVKKERIGD